MSIRSKYSDEDRKQLDKVQYMRLASLEDRLQLTDMVFEVAALIRESTDSAEQQKAFAVQKDMALDLVKKKENFRLDQNNIFEELGKSGLRASDRPAFQLMCKKRHGMRLIFLS